jgi:uncharacterized protein YjbJ (UPF0337 family)
VSENTDQQRGEAMVDNVKGKGKDAWGSLTGDSSTEAEGKMDQLKGKAKETLADVKDAVDGDNADKQNR